MFCLFCIANRSQTTYTDADVVQSLRGHDAAGVESQLLHEPCTRDERGAEPDLVPEAVACAEQEDSHEMNYD